MRVVIAGGGISGLSLAYWLRQMGGEGLEVTVLESAGKTGGKILTEKVEGYLCEWGVNGFLDNKPRTLELSGQLSLEPIRGAEEAKKRFIYSGGTLHRLPESPPAFLKSNLISISGKLRIMLEAVKPGGGSETETLAEFARRRLGSEAFEKLIDPMATGIYAGDPEDMNLKSAFPRIFDIEQEYGSLIRGMFRIMAERKKNVGAGPGGSLASFREGMQSLTDTLAAGLGSNVRLNSRVAGVDSAGHGYSVHLADGSRVDADVAVLAVPAYQASEALRQYDSEASAVLGEIPYPPVSVICTGFKKATLSREPEGFGLLVPYREGRKVLGILVDSNIYPGRAPEDRVLLRTMVGGARAPSVALLDDAKLIDTVMAEMKAILGIDAEPDFVKVYRHERAIPQYNRNHPARLSVIEERINRDRGLYVTGNALRGIGVNDCIENSFKLAERIIRENA